MMKRGYIILISGAILLIAGIVISAIWGASFANSFMTNNTIVAKTIINAGQSVSAKTDVTQLDRPISLAIGIDRTGQQQASSSTLDTRLREIITDPNGKVVSNNEFGDSFFTSFKPETPGVYTVTVSNLSTTPITIGGTFGHMPFMGTNGKPDINAMMTGGGGLGMIILGGGLAATGVIVLIVGGIITVIDSRSGKSSNTTSSSTTSSNGITYRKD
jgi:hypothetical protein